MSLTVIRAPLEGDPHHHERITIDGSAAELDLVPRAVIAGIPRLRDAGALGHDSTGGYEIDTLESVARMMMRRPRPNIDRVFSD